jgi:hypothetical protein
MISGISFHILSDEQKYEIPDFSKFFESKNISKIGNTIVLPQDCMPSSKNFDGNYKDNLKVLYEQLNDSFLKEDEDNIERIREKIKTELKSRIGSGKTGRFRKDIAGKRTDFCARSVMTGNTFLNFNEVSLPIKFKRTLTLSEIYDNQTDILYTIENDKKFDIRFKKPTNGQMIIRTLKENELVLVNRQPTLRTSNFVAMNVKWNKTNTIQLHPGVLSLFDGDFDGDELNIHLPQIDNKLLEKLHIKHELFDVANNSLNPSIIQDASVGNCLSGSFNNKYEVQDEILRNDDILETMKRSYEIGLQTSYFHGFSVGFDLREVDFMVDTKSKGNSNHKSKIREYLNGLRDENYFDEIRKCRVSQISTSLKTAKAGYISRRLAYHLDDVINEHGQLKDGKFILPTKIPDEFKHIRNIGLYAVSCITPPITQSILDSFHYASSGEDFTDATEELEKILNCSDENISVIYKEHGIDKVNEYLLGKLKQFFKRKVDEFWLTLLADFICIIGKPIGFSSSSLYKRHQEYLKIDEEHSIPIMKIAKFSSPLKIINESIKQDYMDNLQTNHSREVFLNTRI